MTKSSEIGGARATSFRLKEMGTVNLPGLTDDPESIDVTDANIILIHVKAATKVGYGTSTAIITSGTSFFRVPQDGSISLDVSGEGTKSIYFRQESGSADSDGLSYALWEEC